MGVPRRGMQGHNINRNYDRKGDEVPIRAIMLNFVIHGSFMVRDERSIMVGGGRSVWVTGGEGVEFQ